MLKLLDVILEIERYVCYNKSIMAISLEDELMY